jgi:hypothetical protein
MIIYPRITPIKKKTTCVFSLTGHIQLHPDTPGHADPEASLEGMRWVNLSLTHKTFK